MANPSQSVRTRGRSVRATVVEPLERRSLLSGVSFDASQLGLRGVLNVTGDDGVDDAISVGLNEDKTQIVVTINGDRQDPVDADEVRLVYVRGLSGDDHLSVDGNLNTGRRQIAVILQGDDGNDTLTGGDGGEAFRGGAGDDTIDAGGGFNVVQGGDGDDQITAGGDGGINLILTGEGNNVVRTGDGNDRVICGTGDDDVETGAGNDLVAGGGGNDTINVGEGNNRASGGAGDDQIYAGTGKDLLRGNAGEDTIDGGGGTDTILQDDPEQPTPPDVPAPFHRLAGYKRYLARLAFRQSMDIVTIPRNP